MDPNANHQGPGLRPILPGPFPNSTSPPPPNRPMPKRRQHVTKACNPCRARRSRCNAGRPKCHTCTVKQIDCAYEEDVKPRTTRAAAHQQATAEIYSMLQTGPEDDAQLILRRMRRGNDPVTLLRQLKEGNLLLQMSLVPETRMRYDIPFGIQMPNYLTQSENPYLKSIVYASTFAKDHSGVPSHTSIPVATTSSYLKPYRAATLIEPGLTEIPISKWTSVTTDNNLIRKLLDDYFLNEYPTFPLFQKDYFLEDMVSGRERFCSQLLFNAVMARATQNSDKTENPADFWSPRGLSYQFQAEARRLWEVETEDPEVRLTTIQAAVLIDISHRVNGQDKIAASYLLQALAMAESINLFEPPQKKMKKETRHARLFTSWGLYSYQLSQSYYFFSRPYVSKAPAEPLPDPSRNCSWYGELQVQYPLESDLIPMDLGHLLKARCELHVIMCDIGSHVFGKAAIERKLTSDEVVKYQSQLDSWYRSLPEPLSPINIVFPSQLKLHLEFHKTAWTLWQDLAELDSNAALLARREREILKSKNQFETIMRLYYLRHSYSSADCFMTTFLFTMGSMGLDALETDPNSPDKQQHQELALLATKGLYDQGKFVYITEFVYGIARKRLPNDVRNVLDRHVESQTDIDARQEIATRFMKSEWPLPVAKLKKSLELATVGDQLKECRELSQAAMDANTDGDSVASS